MRPQCVEEVLDKYDIEDEAHELVNLLRAALGDGLPELQCRLYGSIEEQIHTINSDIDIITADIPGEFTADVLIARGYVYVKMTGDDGRLPVRFVWYHPVLDLPLDLLWFGGTLW